VSRVVDAIPRNSEVEITQVLSDAIGEHKGRQQNAASIYKDMIHPLVA
jgi:hypothetical protein